MAFHPKMTPAMKMRSMKMKSVRGVPVEDKGRGRMSMPVRIPTLHEVVGSMSQMRRHMSGHMMMRKLKRR